jgi:hypothetical protein
VKDASSIFGVVYSKGPTSIVRRGMGWECGVVYSKGSTNTLLDSGRLAVWTLDSCCSNIVCGKSPTSTSLENNRLAVWTSDGYWSRNRVI